ncbi:ribosome small subunit-dependent GTPase A [Paenibacillus antri]|uniref:Small ribosomal subunit biogenesis GTPase RsgA n=1 Tax=Paenibacillus antri TaxID=2582848 RepID=A0A5R9GFX8_9BACL|nr:ribosome small subunit-dependent GTPase A [Paenibacillus antri]TLS52288.1 ribosome small subunit-dependent GTPase A [Paenibacillus antri]
MSELERYGWNETREAAFASSRAKGWTPGRVSLEHKRMYRIWTENGELLAELSGKLRFEALGRDDLPAVGDWVAVSARDEEGKATIHGVLPRTSKFSRKTAGGETTEQIVAANVDTVFLVSSLNLDFNPRRLERYLLLAWESGANPVIVLTKADLCPDPAPYLEQAEAIGLGVPVCAVSAETGEGMDAIRAYVTRGRTAALLGSSGVGKSTLANALLGEARLAVAGIREDDARGRHTTTHREMFALPSGGLLIDTPGMREIQLWDVGQGLSETFEDVVAVASGCRFGDCRHEREPGCAVREALRAGTLSEGRYRNYRKMEAEAAYAARKESARLQAAMKRKHRR